ncbi:hypothetical protein L596_006031 [Steinernema carpocapsae]|uniref:Uncharacterized protein n=1 Tax=Steinernema carpocapsae TaxID=34508 RepID=A0A4U8V0Z6_STECR|nr:hypothetical protein L596_006031 [Steinernema carpocapsae]
MTDLPSFCFLPAASKNCFCKTRQANKQLQKQWAPNRTCEEYRSRFKARTSRRDLGGSSPRKTVEAEACWCC